jgi:ABC-type antimicrobial peptide transport system permease subunit
LLLVWTGGSTAPGSAAMTIERYRTAEERLSALPGVISASAAGGGILTGDDYLHPSSDFIADGVSVRPGLTGLRLVTSRLYGVSARDPRAYVSAIASLVAVAAVATLVPAWRASRLDPAETLRSE